LDGDWKEGEEMNAGIDVVTLAVSDLERALAFYRAALGLDSPGVTGTDFGGDETNAAGASSCSGSTAALSSRSTLVASSPRTPRFRPAPPRAASSDLAVSSQRELTSMRSLPAPKPPVRR
jgi:hypothetical protein